MSRHLVALLLLAATVSAQAVTPARESANGAGGTCPETAAAPAQGDEETAVASRDPATAKADAASQGSKPAVLTRPNRTGTRWHSFLPGMFK